MESFLESSFLDNMIGLYKNTTREDKEIYINILLISMKDIEDIEYFSVVAPEIFENDDKFSSYILKEQKYIFLHYKEDFLKNSQKNNLIYLLCFLLKEIINSKEFHLPTQNIKNMIIIIISSIVKDDYEQDDYLIRCCLSLADFCTMPEINKKIELAFQSQINKSRTLNAIFFEEKIKEMLSLLLEICNEDTIRYNTQINEVNNYLNKINQSKSQLTLELLLDIYVYIDNFSCTRKMQKRIITQMNKNNLDDILIFEKPNLFTSVITIIGAILEKEYYSIKEKYYSFKSFYYEIKTILEEPSFQENIYKIMTSAIIKKLFNDTRGYEELTKILENKTKRSEFFKKTFTVMNIPTNSKGYTNRYLQIVLNYSGITISPSVFH